MYFIDLAKEEIAEYFQEIVRFDAFYSESSNCWLQRVLGTCYEFFVIDQRNLKEDPSTTALSDQDNIASHWFQDVTGCQTKYLFRALGEGKISEETYRALADEDVRIDCVDGDKLNRYVMLCPKCGKEFSIYAPAERRYSVAGTVPSCPFCGEFSVSVIAIPSYCDLPENGEITISDTMCGGQAAYDQYRLYPQVEGEDDQKRQNRIVSYTLVEASSDEQVVQMPAADCVSVAHRLYEKNPRIMHVALDVLRVFCEADGDEGRAQAFEALDAVTERDDGNAAMRHFGAVTRVPAGVPQKPAGDNLGFIHVDAPNPCFNGINRDMPAIGMMGMGPSMGMGMGPSMGMGMGLGAGMNSQTVSGDETTEGHADAARRFCANCGSKLSEGAKFCAVCGSPVQ